jgi:hypothetical protein
VFDIAMRRRGTEDRDGFFMQVIELVANTWLTKDDRQAVEQLLSEQRYSYTTSDVPRLDPGTVQGHLIPVE